MNKIYKKIFNKARGCFGAVSKAMPVTIQNAVNTEILVVASSLTQETHQTNALLKGFSKNFELSFRCHRLYINSLLHLSRKNLAKPTYWSGFREVLLFSFGEK